MRLPGQLGRDEVHLLYGGLLDNLADVPHQCRADLPGEMRLAARVVREGVEGVEDAERSRPEPDRVPGDRVRLLVDERQPALQELLDL